MSTSSFTPCFPPVILEKCLDFSKHLSQMKTGKASLQIKLGNSSFIFSVENSSFAQTGRPSQGKIMKKKSPSDRRRDALRKEKFLAKKRNFSPPDAPSPNSNSSSDSPIDSPKESPVTVTVESPPIAKDTETMETADELVEDDIADPETRQTRIHSVANINVPPALSPITSPEKATIKTTVPPEMIISFCAPDGASAINQSKRISSQLKPLGVTSTFPSQNMIKKIYQKL